VLVVVEADVLVFLADFLVSDNGRLSGESVDSDVGLPEPR
jgi:hypothetical protein